MSGTDGGETDAPDRLVLPDPLRDEMTRGLEQAYPREGCGVLLGGIDDGDRRVSAVRAADNRWSDRDDRYLVDPGTLRRLVEREDRGGPRILGFYHSHPDADPVPSSTDREHAWPWYLYLIVPVRGGRARPGRAWQLDGQGGFAERPVVRAAADRPGGRGRA